MARIALPARARANQRMGLATLWKDSVYSAEGKWSRWSHLLSLLITRLRVAPLSFLASVISLCSVVTLTALLVATAWLIRDILSQGSERLSLRIVPAQEEAAALNELKGTLGKIPEVKSVRLIDKEEARQELERSLRGASGILDGLSQDNPLPITFELSLHQLGEEPAATVRRVAADLQKDPAVAEVIYHESVLTWLSSILRGVRVVGSVGVALVLAIGALVVGMTIRLGIYAHRNEIEVMQLVGADSNFVRLPFLVEAAAVGVFAGALSGVCVFSTLWWINIGLSTSKLGWLFNGQALSIAFPLAGIAVLLGPALASIGALIAVRLQGAR